MFIYKVTNTINGKVYIGQTILSISKRWSLHKSPNSNCTVLRKAIQKYGPENFTIEEIDGANSLSELNYLETHYICKFNSLDRNVGYNLKSGGDNSKHSQSTKEKISKAMKGRVFTKEHIENKRKANLGKKIPKKVREKISKTLTGRKRAYKIKCIDNGKIYFNYIEAAEELGIKRQNIADFFYGKTKTAKGYTFIKVN